MELLLTNEASANIVDVKGSSPLHLAAWSGNVDIVRMLLCHGPSIPNVNLMVRNKISHNNLYKLCVCVCVICVSCVTYTRARTPSLISCEGLFLARCIYIKVNVNYGALG